MSSFRKFFRAYLPVLLVILALALTLRYLVQISLVPSESMEPVISKNSIIIGSRLSTPSKGDIIIFRKDGVNLVKRIIATGGETVSIKNGSYYVNGMKEKHGSMTLPEKNTDFTVPRGCFFVSGDNRMHSTDSRNWTDPYIKEKDVISKIIFSGW